MEYNIISIEETDSTNSIIKRAIHGKWLTQQERDVLPSEILAEGLTVTAQRQTGGRGRRGRVWNSGEGCLMFSLLLKPDIDIDKLSMLTILGAVAVARIVRGYDIPCMIKWPNDIVFDGKKLCGILTELEQRDEECFVIMGIGINIFFDDFPEDIRQRSISLRQIRENNYSTGEILKEILEEILGLYRRFCTEGSLDFCRREYNDIMAGKGKKLGIISGGAIEKGVALGIASRGELVVEDKEGNLKYYSGGEVSIDGIYGE